MLMSRINIGILAAHIYIVYIAVCVVAADKAEGKYSAIIEEEE
jgi:hypothetical protein